MKLYTLFAIDKRKNKIASFVFKSHESASQKREELQESIFYEYLETGIEEKPDYEYRISVGVDTGGDDVKLFSTENEAFTYTKKNRLQDVKYFYEADIIDNSTEELKIVEFVRNPSKLEVIDWARETIKKYI
jgi:hypothetical protein